MKMNMKKTFKKEKVKGKREYFVYSVSGKYTAEDIINKLSEKFTINNTDNFEPTVLLYCKSKVLKDFTHLDNEFKKDTEGIIISPENIEIGEVKEILSKEMDNDVKINMTSFLEEDYNKCFKDYGFSNENTLSEEAEDDFEM